MNCPTDAPEAVSSSLAPPPDCDVRLQKSLRGMDGTSLIARGKAGLEGAAEAFERLGGTPLVLQADVIDLRVLEVRARVAVAAWAGIALWIKVAMVTMVAPAAEACHAPRQRCAKPSPTISIGLAGSRGLACHAGAIHT